MTDVPKTEAQDSVKVEDKSDFVKLISDFTKDVLPHFLGEIKTVFRF